MIPYAAPVALPNNDGTATMGARTNSIKIDKKPRRFGVAYNLVKAAVHKREHFYGKKIVKNVKAFAPYATGELSRGGRYHVGEPKHGLLVLHSYVERDPGPWPRSYRPDHAKYYVPMAINFGRRDRPATRANPPLFFNRAVDATARGGWKGIRNGIVAAAAAALRKFAKTHGYDPTR